MNQGSTWQEINAKKEAARRAMSPVTPPRTEFIQPSPVVKPRIPRRRPLAMVFALVAMIAIVAMAAATIKLWPTTETPFYKGEHRVGGNPNRPNILKADKKWADKIAEKESISITFPTGTVVYKVLHKDDKGYRLLGDADEHNPDEPNIVDDKRFELVELTLDKPLTTFVVWDYLEIRHVQDGQLLYRFTQGKAATQHSSLEHFTPRTQ